MTARAPAPFALRPGQHRRAPSGRPDFEYIRRHIPITAVARELGIRVLKHYRAHCWRVENHQHGDRTPSLSFQIKKNRGMCFVCDDHTWSNIDLVMLKLECNLHAAVRWLIERFPVPSRPAGSHIEKREGWFPRFHSGVNENVMTLMIRSGMWGDLTVAEQSVLAVLITFSDNQDRCAQISYRGLMRYTGVRSRTTVARAIRRFERLRVLKIERLPRQLLRRGVNQYTLTIDDPRFEALVAARYQKTRQEIALEKELRAKDKKDQQRCQAEKEKK
jgi:hypothetical protein